MDLSMKQFCLQSARLYISTNKKFSYRKQVARQLRTQYVEGICSNSVSLKSGLQVIQGHCNWYQSKAFVLFPIRLL